MSVFVMKWGVSQYVGVKCMSVQCSVYRPKVKPYLYNQRIYCLQNGMTAVDQALICSNDAMVAALLDEDWYYTQPPVMVHTQLWCLRTPLTNHSDPRLCGLCVVCVYLHLQILLNAIDWSACNTVYVCPRNFCCLVMKPEYQKIGGFTAYYTQ